MKEPDNDTQVGELGSLEQSDTQESLRQLWWTIGVTLAGIALMAYLYL